MQAPGFQITHGYGEPFGTSPDTADDDWAGEHYPKSAALPEVPEPVDQPA